MLSFAQPDPLPWAGHFYCLSLAASRARTALPSSYSFAHCSGSFRRISCILLAIALIRRSMFALGTRFISTAFRASVTVTGVFLLSGVVPFPVMWYHGWEKGGDFVVDTDKLRMAIRHFVFVSEPSNRNLDRPCTASELEKAIHEVAKLMNAFVDELEKE